MTIAGFRLVILDLDLTLWDHPDASVLIPPFSRESIDTASDAEGKAVNLMPGARRFLERCSREGLMVSIASWNRPRVALLLECLGVLRHFQHPIIEFHPDKVRMVSSLMATLREEGRAVETERTLFVDDNAEMVGKVKRAFPRIAVLQFSLDVKDFFELERIVFER